VGGEPPRPAGGSDPGEVEAVEVQEGGPAPFPLQEARKRQARQRHPEDVLLALPGPLAELDQRRRADQADAEPARWAYHHFTLQGTLLDADPQKDLEDLAELLQILLELALLRFAEDAQRDVHADLLPLSLVGRPGFPVRIPCRHR